MKFTYLAFPLAILLMAGCTSEDTPSTSEKVEEPATLKQKKSSRRLKRVQTTQIRRRLPKSLQQPRKRSQIRLTIISPAIN